MNEDSDAEALRPPSLGPWLRALAANVLLAALLVGIPYWRGRERAVGVAHAVASVAACLTGGAVRLGVVGLAGPADERERFGAQYFDAPTDWPTACRRLAERIAPEPAIFLFPAPKSAEAELATRVSAFREALTELAAARTRHDRVVSDATLDALARLRGAAAALLEANDVTFDPTALAVTYPPSAIPLPTPSRIPLRTGEGELRVERAPDETLRLVAADRSSVADVRVRPAVDDDESANVTIVQLRRPRSANGLVVASEGVWLVWATAESRCERDPRRCAYRMTGLGFMNAEVRAMQPEHWLAAHPAFEPSRSLAVGESRFTVLARNVDGSVEARSFPRRAPQGELEAPLSETPHGDASSDVSRHPEPTRAAAAVPLEGLLDAWVGDGEVWWLARSEDGVQLRSSAVGAVRPREAVVVVPDDARLLERCGAFFVALGVGVTIVKDGEVWSRWPRLAGSRVLDASSSRPRIACGREVVALGARSADGVLHVARCVAGGCESRPWPLGPVDTFDVSVVGEEVWAAASDRPSGAILVGAVPFEPAPRPPAPCWSSGVGFCGEPRFARGVEGAPVLVAREGSDALALVWDGQRWNGIRGLGARASGRSHEPLGETGPQSRRVAR